MVAAAPNAAPDNPFPRADRLDKVPWLGLEYVLVAACHEAWCIRASLSLRTAVVLSVVCYSCP